MAKERPYITVMADAPMDSRFDAAMWFAWSRILATCRLKRACTAATWPAAELRLRGHELCSIVAVGRTDVARTLVGRLADVGVDVSLTFDGTLYIIRVSNYASYQKLGRPTSATRSSDVSDPPSDPPTLRPSPQTPTESSESPAARAAAPTPRSGRPPNPPRRSLTPAPDDLTAEEHDQLREWCETHEDAHIRALAPGLRALVAACLDHHRAKGNRHADWVATCRTWARNHVGRFAAARASPAAARFESPNERNSRGLREAVSGAVDILRAQREARAARGGTA